MPSQLVTDVAVLGGGPAASSAAATVAAAGRSVVQISPEQPGLEVGENIAPAVPLLIDEIFPTVAWQPSSHLKCFGADVSWGGQTNRVEYMLDRQGEGWVVDRPRFLADLRNGAVLLGVKGVCGSAGSFRLRKGVWEFRTDTKSIHAGVVVDATGRRGVLTRELGIPRHHGDNLVAIWAQLGACSQDQVQRIVVESTDNGWWYSARLPDSTRMVIYFTDGDLLDRRMLNVPGFVTAAEQSKTLAEQVERRKTAVSTVLIRSGPQVTTARTSWLESLAGDRWVAAGDSLISFDPLSSQGIVSALLTGRSAGHAAIGMLASDTNPLNEHKRTARAVLRHYQQGYEDAYRIGARGFIGKKFWERRVPDQPAMTVGT